MITSSMGFEYPLRLVQYQNEFGQGLYGDAVAYENTSWGPAFDNKFHYWGNEIDNTLRVKSYRGLPDNVKEFFTTGRNYNNSISVSSGNEHMTYYLSYSNVTSDGIFPTNSDSYKRNTLVPQEFGKTYQTADNCHLGQLCEEEEQLCADRSG